MEAGEAWWGGPAGGGGGEGVVDERYVMLGGCTDQRYEALQDGEGCQIFRKKVP